MTESRAIDATERPATRASLAADFARLGLAEGDTVLVHSSLTAIGFVVGGGVTVVQALLDAVGERGTLVMPAFTSYNSEPSLWIAPPVPEAWWPAIRAHMPAYDKRVFPMRQIGQIAEVLRAWEGTLRSDHPQVSFIARGRHAERLTADHGLEFEFGERSPLARLYELDGSVLLLGVTHAHDTSLHLAEDRAPGKEVVEQGSCVLDDGRRVWKTFRDIARDDSVFAELGRDFDAAHGVTPGKVGVADARLFRQRALVDFGVEWLAERRAASGGA